MTEENKEAWRRYLTKIVKKHLKAEVMNTPEFMDIVPLMTRSNDEENQSF